ncbi:MAG: leucine-rich repeat protein, partial [Muribaculaceae bacterium]|nr:leucine-rich repeat protein [Muribaculaceae bacterium]
SKIRFYFPTYDAIEKAKSTSYIASNNYVDPTPDLVTGEVVDSNNNFYVATTGVFNSSSVGELALVGTLSGQNSVLITTQALHTLLGKPYAITSVAPMAYYNNKNIITVRLDGSEITKIGDRAFYGCTNLTAAYLSNYTTTVEMAAFMDAGITTITIPETVKTLGSYAFSAATLTSVTWNATNANDISTSSAQPFEFCDNLQTFTVGANVTRMPTNLLTSNTSIKTVNWNARSAADFPDYYSSTFRGHSSITSFKFGNNVQHIPAYLCYILPNLALVSLPQSVKTIGRYAFAETGIMAVTIPSGVTSLGERAFGSCENLTTVYYNATSCDDMYPVDTDKAPFNGSLLTSFIIGNGVKRIPILLCRKQWALHSIVFPESLTEIGDLAFIECDSFESLTFPKNLESIGQSSFSGCTNVTNINAKMMNPASLTYGNDYIFAGVDKNACTLTVPNGTIPKYKAIMPWSEFFHIVQENGGILGDLDGNGILEVNDVVLLADIAMGGSGNGVDITVADMDGNGLIEVNDVVILAGMVMGS